jgi:hypothetical protein
MPAREVTSSAVTNVEIVATSRTSPSWERRCSGTAKTQRFDRPAAGRRHAVALEFFDELVDARSQSSSLSRSMSSDVS